MRELLVKKVEKKEKREEKKGKVIDHMIEFKKARNFRAVLQCPFAKSFCGCKLVSLITLPKKGR